MSLGESQAGGRAPRGIKALIKLLRVHEWVKNVFVAAPLLFSGSLGDLSRSFEIILVIFALCAFSSAVYVFNDLNDRNRDKQHPVKRFRPLASGTLSPATAVFILIGLLIAGGVLLMRAKAPVLVWVYTGIYLALNLAYTLYLKRKVIVDVLTIAIGYVLRVLIGGAMIAVAVTHWLILCTFLLATFLGFSKRRHELTELGLEATHHRPVLSLYSKMFLDQASLLTLGMTVTCYLLYTIAPDTVQRFGTTALVYSGVIVIFALFRYLFLIHVKKLGSPVEVLYYDRQILLAVICWILYVVGVVYTYPLLRR